MAKTELSYEDVVRDIQKRDFKPIYYLMGEEPYYIDKISDYLLNQVLTEEQRDFNLTVFYGADTSASEVAMAARRYPMLSDYQVVLVKEAQQLGNLDALSDYLRTPQSQTILICCHKNGALDRRKKITTEIEQIGVLFESRKLKDAQLRTFIVQCVGRHKLTIDEKSVQLLMDAVGSDLNRMAGEIEKLVLTMPKGQTRIVADMIERNIGISKEFNNYELKNALLKKDVFKANQIANYFNKNSRSNPIQMTLAMLFNFYSNLMLAHYAPDKSEQGVADYLGLRQGWQSREYLEAMRVYSARKTMNIIDAIRKCDARSKGIDNKSVDSGLLLRDLLYFILH